jgi:PAT family beta-lactamase induction signal transducer AmpG
VTGWAPAFAAGAALFIFFAAFHAFYLPGEPELRSSSSKAVRKSFSGAFSAYLGQERIAAILMFIMFYRLGDFLWKPMAKPFLMDIGVTVSQIGFLNGVIGIIATIIGTLIGGIYIAKRGLVRGLWVLGIIQSATLILYAWLAYVHPPLPKGNIITYGGLLHVGIINTFENFAYGLGTIAFVNFLMWTCQKEYHAAHYAIATGLMAIASTLSSFVSGFLVKQMQYLAFFFFCFLASIPGLILILFLPLKKMDDAKE